jgi:hypothetical protein
MSVVLPLALAWAFLALSRWGRRNVAELVPVTLSPERRAREERRLLRGARSLLGLSVVCVLFAAVEAVSQVTGWK